MDTPDKGMVHMLGQKEQNVTRFHHAAQNGVQLKTSNCLVTQNGAHFQICELLSFDIFYLIFSDHD